MLHWLPWLLETWRDCLGIPKQCSFEWVCCCIDQHQEVMLSFRLCEFSLIKNTKRGKKNHTNFGIKQLKENVYQSLYYNLYKIHRSNSIYLWVWICFLGKRKHLIGVAYLMLCSLAPCHLHHGLRSLMDIWVPLDGRRSVGFPCILLLGSWLHHTLSMQVKSSGTHWVSSSGHSPFWHSFSSLLCVAPPRAPPACRRRLSWWNTDCPSPACSSCRCHGLSLQVHVC